MEAKRRSLWAGAGVAAALTAMPASAAPWTMSSGAAEHFTYANGQDLNGLFGDPIVSGDTFFFPDYLLAASAENGETNAQEDTVSVDIHANPGWTFSLLRITSFGSYSASGDASVDFDGLLTLDERVAPFRHFQGSMTTNPSFPKSNDNGSWSGLAVVDLSFEFPQAAQEIHLAYANNVLAISGPGGSAHIVANPGGGFELAIGMIPEPATMTLLLAAGLFAPRPRRRG